MEIYIFIGVFLLLITCIAPRDKTVFYPFCILFAMIRACSLTQCRNRAAPAYSSAFRKITLNPNTWNLILPFEPGFNVLCALFKPVYIFFAYAVVGYYVYQLYTI